MAAYFGFAGCISSWAARKGIAEQQAREHLSLMFAGLFDAGREGTGGGFEEIATAHATPGGLNEQVLGDLKANGFFDVFTAALDRVHLRATGHSA